MGMCHVHSHGHRRGHYFVDIIIKILFFIMLSFYNMILLLGHVHSMGMGLCKAMGKSTCIIIILCVVLYYYIFIIILLLLLLYYMGMAMGKVLFPKRRGYPRWTGEAALAEGAGL